MPLAFSSNSYTSIGGLVIGRAAEYASIMGVNWDVYSGALEIGIQA